MTLGRFATKNAFRNRRRSLITAVSIGFSLLLLTLLMSVYRGFYIDQGPPVSALRLVTRHKVSLSSGFLHITARRYEPFLGCLTSVRGTGSEAFTRTPKRRTHLPSLVSILTWS